jgi:hypothetical protein
MATTENTIMEKKRSDWKNLIQGWLKSNFSIAEYCNQNNLSQSTFQYWRAKFGPNNKRGKMDNGVETPKFVPVEIAVEPPKDKENEDSLLLQYPNGCLVRINKEFDLKILQRINIAMGIKSC